MRTKREYSKVFLNRRKLLSDKDLGAAGQADRPKLLPAKDLGRLSN
jgi:hypothetical protein